MSITQTRILQLALERLEEQKSQIVAELAAIDVLQKCATAGPAATGKRKYTRRLGRPPGSSAKRPMSEAHRQAIAVAVKARWAAKHAAQAGRKDKVS